MSIQTQSLQEKPLGILFIICLLFHLFSPLYFFEWPLLFFSPFLVILYYQRSFLNSLWWSLSCGLILDFLSSSAHVGIFSANYVLTTFILYHQQRNYFADSFSTLPLMIFLFSCLSTIIQVVALFTFGKGFIFSQYWIFTDLLLMPILDAIYGTCCFVIIPSILFYPRWTLLKKRA